MRERRFVGARHPRSREEPGIPAVRRCADQLPFVGTKRPVAKLEKRLERGDLKLHYDSKHGYLKSILDALHISVSSQALVFSKTSFQYPEINPAAPRALYYNDDVYVGQVHDGRFLEFVSFDPMQGAIFYVMDEHRDKHPRFERSEVDCIQCHVAPVPPRASRA